MVKALSDERKSRHRYSAATWLLFSTALFVLGSRGEEKPLRRIELLLLESHQPAALTVGLHIELAPDWYLYWINPGDAGLAPEITWDLPSGYKAGPLRFPTPEKIVHGEIVAYGFKDEVIILCEISPAVLQTPTEMPIIACRLDWMACRESCTTGRDTAKVSPAAQTQADLKRSREVLSRFKARFPKPFDTARIAIPAARLVQSGNSRQVEIRLSGKDVDRITDFYPYPLENFVVAHSRIAASGGKVIIPLEPSGPSATLVRVDGLLILGDDACEVTIPVKPKDHSS
jgi:DsbC/DsbD-like thiol-disulfide interchange protein